MQYATLNYDLHTAQNKRLQLTGVTSLTPSVTVHYSVENLSKIRLHKLLLRCVIYLFCIRPPQQRYAARYFILMFSCLAVIIVELGQPQQSYFIRPQQQWLTAMTAI